MGFSLTKGSLKLHFCQPCP